MATFAIDLEGLGAFRYVSEHNAALRAQTAVRLGSMTPGAGLNLSFTMVGDRFVDSGNSNAILLRSQAHDSGFVRLSSVMACGALEAGLDCAGLQGVRLSAQHLTLADNGVGLRARLGQSLDHCVFAGNNADVFGSPALTYSCFQSSTVGGAGNLNRTDPQLVRPFYKLKPSSPCIDAGDPRGSFGSTDYEGDPRVSRGRSSTGGPEADMGADEYVLEGSARTYGTGGFGEFAFAPRISAGRSAVRIGDSLLVGLAGAIYPVFGNVAQFAALSLGSIEDSGRMPFEMSSYGPAGRRGSLIWNDLLAVLPAMVRRDGTANTSLVIPNDPRLVGEIFTCQWLTITDFGFVVSSDGLRITIGR